MNKTVLILISLFTFNVLNAQIPGQKEIPFPEAKILDCKKISYRIILSTENTFGYDIFANENLLIHQPSIPGLPGNSGFKTKQSAEQIAMLVIDKIKKGEMPPSVTEKEMKDLKAIP